MLRFFGSELELAVDFIVERRTSPIICAARDANDDRWLILQVDDDPSHLAWVCAPVSESALQAVIANPPAAWSAACHSLTGTAELVVVDHGRAQPDRCVLGSWLATNSPTANRGEYMAA
jgi:hypothetical protein